MSPRSKRWEDGFDAGVLSALAVIGEDNTTYREIVKACGATGLLAAAERDGDSQQFTLRQIVADNKARRRRDAKRHWTNSTGMR